jgi:hypothetical protein
MPQFRSHIALYRRYTRTLYSDLENQLETIIQREYTAIHSSVYGNSEMRRRSISIQIPQIKITSLRKFFKEVYHYTVRLTSKAPLSTETRL